MRKTLRQDISLSEIKNLYKKERDGRLKEKLLAIKLAYEQNSIADISEQLSVCKKTIYNWLDLWNEEGLAGLKTKHGQAGRKGYLTAQEWQEILNEIKGQGLKVSEIQHYVNQTRGIQYSYQAVWRILHHQSDR